MSKKALSMGDFVKCNYRARWKGVITSIEKRKELGNNKVYTVCDVLMLKDRCGRSVKKRIVMKRGEGWLEKIEPFTVSSTQAQWLPKIIYSTFKKRGLYEDIT